MRLAASVPGGMAGEEAVSLRPRQKRSSAPNPPPMAMAASDFHMGPCTLSRRRRAMFRVCSAPDRGTHMRASVPSALAAASLAALLTARSPAARQHAADARLREIYTSEWKWRSDQLPPDEDGTRPLADHLPKVEPATQRIRLTYWEDVLLLLDGLAPPSPSAAEQVHVAVYHAQIAVLIANQRFRDFQ